ncbi:SDR family NAD(P)-dependent oxidoreductase [Aquimarina sp. AD1]|uniref:SDR family oxidoreductase n=1 Tax=Aquimarina sp. (strain AD1) TaxID=1714848 RepID=UPI000E4AE40E|nr:SDR family oxidoreductase [Aquimarina sp. AD1]AXT55038.1 SDR family NAD(P)-dependent oxidoreductase [Aquimarina sp. AD1]RKN22936.1 SDR family NAD(P)-dependent oxidoreductase [Aquimarina sp. AD1]
MNTNQLELLSSSTVLVTGAAGFIGSNLCEALLEANSTVVGLDNFATGHKKNLTALKENPNFTFIEGDIRNLEDCNKACKGVDYILHQAALGSVPRSINDPLTSNDVNVGGFLNMLVAARDAGVKRFIYAASSSTYGDSEALPKIEDKIGKPLSPYAITKYVNELYADNFKRTYDLDTVGLRYFNVFGRKQDPNGAYAAVIPKFVMQFMKYESPVINGDGSFSRDFTYIDNVIQMNLRAIVSDNEKALNNVYNTAFGERTTLNELVTLLKEYLSEFDSKISNVEVKKGPERKGDVPHSLASVDKAKALLNYDPKFDIKSGLKEAVKWYWDNLK